MNLTGVQTCALPVCSSRLRAADLRYRGVGHAEIDNVEAVRSGRRMADGTGIWITGIGTANPLGTSYAQTAENLLAARPGVRAIERFDTTRHNSRIAGLVREVP